MKKFLFDKPLIKSLIKPRPNRFIMLVEIDGVLEKCHCPSTGRIGNIVFKDIPCLLSKSNNSSRKTRFTVEAVSPENGLWLGINQTKANSYVEFFLKNNYLSKMIKVNSLRREVKLNNSRIDFLVNDNCFLEVKTPLRFLPFGDKPVDDKFSSFDRLIRHFQDISSQIEHEKRAIVLLCYLFDAKRFRPPKASNNKILSVVKKEDSKGLEHWQVNLSINEKGVSLIRYFKLNLF